MSVQLVLPIFHPLTSYAAASPARTSAPRASGMVSPRARGPVFGSSTSALWESSGRGSSSLRTLRLARPAGCVESGPICTLSDTEPVPSRFLPRTSERRTFAGVSSLLPTPTASDYGTNQGGASGRTGKARPSLSTMARHGLWPTPTVCGNYNRAGASPTSGDGLATAVKRWPTPCAIDEKGPGPKSGTGKDLPQEVGGSLNPTWVAWLMGFPLDWLDVDDALVFGRSATRSSRSAPK